MTDKLKSQVSAFVDDELLEAESELLVRRLCNDPQLRTAAARYSMIGDAMRGSLHEIRTDLASNIMRAIDGEPAVATPAVAVAAGRWQKAVGGGVLAAAVATIAVLSLRPATAPTGEVMTVASDEPAVTVPVDSDSPRPLMSPVSSAVRPAGNQSRLNRLMIRHNEYATTMGRQGVLTYSSLGVSEADSTRWGAQRGADGAGAENKGPDDKPRAP